MHGPTCVFWANLTPFSLKGCADVFLPFYAHCGQVSRAPAGAHHLHRRAGEEILLSTCTVRQTAPDCSRPGQVFPAISPAFAKTMDVFYQQCQDAVRPSQPCAALAGKGTAVVAASRAPSAVTHRACRTTRT